MWFASVPSTRLSGMSVKLSGLSALSGLSTLLCLSAICVSAYIPHATFRYEPQSSRRVDSCNMCFADECWALQKERCWYYAEVHEALEKVEAGGVQGEVDTLVHDMITEASSSWVNQECIPFVSEHTDCHKENICVGCKTCSCDAFGKWNCKDVQRCRAEPYLDVDHRILVTVGEVINNDNTTRKKRYIEEKPEITTAVPRKIDYAEIVEWMYGVKPNIALNLESTTHANSKSSKSVTETTTSKTNGIDTDRSKNIEFDEVLKYIGIDNIKYKRRKPQLNKTNNTMDQDEIIVVKNNDSDNFLQILNAIVDGNENSLSDSSGNESSKIVIDLLSAFKNDSLNGSDFQDLNSNTVKEENSSDETNNQENILYRRNIIKRDVASVTKLNATTASMINKSYNNTTVVSPVALKNDVLIPLNKIIDDKQQELKDLTKIRENLIQFITKYNKTGPIINVSQEVLNNTNTVLSVYNVDVFPEIQVNLRKINPTVIDKLLYKLKRDIYEVIRDILGIKKITKAIDLPEDLKTLVRAMSLYVYKQRNVSKLQNNTRRRHNLDEEVYPYFNSTKDYIINILKVLDKNMPQSDALSHLSQGTRKIIKRIIKNYYVEDFSSISLTVYGPDYNMTNDIRKIGNNWQILTDKIESSEPVDKIYAMKLLHLTLSVDILRMNDALALIDFAHSRRMIPIDGSIGEDLLDQINHGLKSIDDKIQVIIRYRKGSEDRVNGSKQKTIPIKRNSFMNKLRNLLKGSKKDIVEMVNKNVPRSKIVKTIAKKRLDELAQKKLNDYEETMRKWQNTFNVIPRNKRSFESKTNKNRLKDIIPKYLRGKLNPAIAAKQLKKTNQQKEATLKKPSLKKQKKMPANSKPTKHIDAKSNNSKNVHIPQETKPMLTKSRTQQNSGKSKHSRRH